MNQDKKQPSQPFVIMVVIFGVLCGATASLFIRHGTAPSLVLAAYRKTFAALLLLPLVLVKHRDELMRLKKKTLGLSILAGVFMAIHFFTYFMAVKYTTVTASNVLAGTEVLFISVFSFISGKEKYNRYTTTAIVLALIGGIIVSKSKATTPPVDATFGNMCAVICAIAIASFTLLSRKIRQEQMSNVLYNFIAYGSAAFALDLAVFFSSYRFFGYGKINYLVALGMAICCSLLCHSLHTWSLGYINPTLLSILKTANPIPATILSFLVLSEVPGVFQIIGGCIVITAIILYNVNAGKNNSK